jgi:acyl dehydratase
MAEMTALRSPRGGMYYEDFEVGRLYPHTLRRTVTQMDNMLFSNMTLNPQPLHIDREFCAKETDWGQPLMNSLFTLGLMIGIQVSDMTRATRCIAPPRSSASASRNRGRAPASSTCISAPITRTTSWSPNASGRRSC